MLKGLIKEAVELGVSYGEIAALSKGEVKREAVWRYQKRGIGIGYGKRTALEMELSNAIWQYKTLKEVNEYNNDSMAFMVDGHLVISRGRPTEPTPFDIDDEETEI